MAVKSLLWTLSWVPVAITFSQTVAQLSWIQGSSMYPALNPDTSLGTRDIVLLKKIGVHKPNGLKRGSVVVFRSPMDPERILVKRVLGLPGETIRPRQTSLYPKAYQKIPENHVWVEGDNIHSVDSNTFGPISSGLVIGEVACVVFPFARFGAVPAGGRLKDEIVC